jgi:hypothetical protein
MILTSSGGLCSYVPDVIVKRVAVSDKRDLVFGGYVPERPKNDQKYYKPTILLPETKRIGCENTLRN